MEGNVGLHSKNSKNLIVKKAKAKRKTTTDDLGNFIEEVSNSAYVINQTAFKGYSFEENVSPFETSSLLLKDVQSVEDIKEATNCITTTNITKIEKASDFAYLPSRLPIKTQDLINFLFDDKRFLQFENLNESLIKKGFDILDKFYDEGNTSVLILLKRVSVFYRGEF